MPKRIDVSKLRKVIPHSNVLVTYSFQERKWSKYAAPTLVAFTKQIEGCPRGVMVKRWTAES